MPSAHSFTSPVFRPPHAAREKREVPLASCAIQWINKDIKERQLHTARFSDCSENPSKEKSVITNLCSFNPNFSSGLSGKTPISESFCVQGGGKSPGSRWEISTLSTHAQKKVQLSMVFLLSWSLLL